jgi:hypothetical protein
MIDYALTFPDETTWVALADEQGWVQYEYSPPPDPLPDPYTPVVDNIFYNYPNISFVVIGAIYPPPPEPLPDPYVPVPYPGFGVNLRFVEGSLPDTMTQYIVEPNPQQYTFAGGWFGETL